MLPTDRFDIHNSQQPAQLFRRHFHELLPESFREILVLRELEGCFYKEIAESLRARSAP
jgi:DNA-directed RNA polymerase specialized sigma24 family protein